MSEPTKAEQLRTELDNLKAALQLAAGGVDEGVQSGDQPHGGHPHPRGVIRQGPGKLGPKLLMNIPDQSGVHLI